MINDFSIAAEVSALLLEFDERLDKSLCVVQDKCTTEEFVAYRTVVGQLRADMYIDVLDRIYSFHPSLRPSGIPAIRPEREV